jgi:cysteine-S-conjugate beta-lyase
MRMQKFDFDTLVDRTGSGNMKHIITPECVRKIGGITFSGAEMDFKTAPVIMEAFKEKALGGLYGYTLCDETYRKTVAGWMVRMRNWPVELDWIVPTYGTIQSLSTAIRAFTCAGDGVILQTPVYMQYQKMIKLNNRVVVSNPLLYQRGKYEIDFVGLEELMAQSDTRMLVLCNPHNPIAKVWGQAELERLAELAARHGVIVFSDEIFGEVVFPGFKARPYSTISGAADHCVVATSMGKAFNFTGFSHANMVIPNQTIRQKFKQQRDIDHYGSIDPFMYTAVLAAYRGGDEWLRAMVAYVYQNALLIQAFFAEHLPQVIVAEPQGAFILWMDWRALGLDEEALNDFLVEEAFFHLDQGSEYGMEGTGFTRMNIASPRAEIQKALDRLLIAAKKRGFTS